MTASQILSTILAAILGVLGKVCEFLVSMAFTDFAVLGSLVLPFVKVVCATIALPAKVLVWVAYFIKAFLIGLLYFVPVLLTSGVPFLGDRQCQPFPQTLEDMLKRSPCAVSPLFVLSSLLLFDWHVLSYYQSMASSFLIDPTLWNLPIQTC
jgi:hypothetical protein